MTQFVVRVVRDVLRYVAIEVLKGRHVRGIAAVRAAELVVLLPEIRLDNLRGPEKLQDRNIAAGEPAPGIAAGGPYAGLDARGQQGTCRQHRRRYADALEKRATPNDVAPVRFSRWCEVILAHCLLLESSSADVISAW